MRTIAIYSLLMFMALSLSAQSDIEKKLILVVNGFFEGMQGDTNKLNEVTHPQIQLWTTLRTEGKAFSRSINNWELKKAVLNPPNQPWHEQLWTYDIFIEDGLATVTTEYTFYMGKDNDRVISHCGVNIFTVVQQPDNEWKIVHIIDTRRKANCIDEGSIQKTKDRIHNFMDNWHKAAATADEELFFDQSMTEDAIYLGTDASERWLRDELKKWSKEYFDRESAWSFKANWRNVYLANNQRMAWFEESLDTWMGECRGSGILERINGEWKIKHYDLSIMIPNDLVKDFLDLVKKGSSKKKKEKKKDN